MAFTKWHYELAVDNGTSARINSIKPIAICDSKDFMSRADSQINPPCTTCQRRKVKCDRRRPCATCLRQRTPCISAFPVTRRRRSTAPKSSGTSPDKTAVNSSSGSPTIVEDSIGISATNAVVPARTDSGESSAASLAISEPLSAFDDNTNPFDVAISPEATFGSWDPGPDGWLGASQTSAFPGFPPGEHNLPWNSLDVSEQASIFDELRPEGSTRSPSNLNTAKLLEDLATLRQMIEMSSSKEDVLTKISQMEIELSKGVENMF